ncbi:site-specific integrase [Clostridium baratii]|uniref:tyrosine-type recombinase/integrase n=1 Tax=Clostridium baratii TaxID=1561 RepID=UPI0030CB191C
MDYNITYREKNKGIQVIVSYKDNLGRWKQKSKQGFPNTREGKRKAKFEADKILQILKEDYKNFSNNEFAGITFREFADIYLKHLSISLEVNTINSYKLSLSHFSYLNDLQLINIKPIDIQKGIDELIVKGYKKGSIKTYLNKIKHIFNAAINDYDINMKNPTTKISIPIDKNDVNKTALTLQELDSLLNSITIKEHYLIALFASKCGLRIGEIIGLTWADIDFKNNTLSVNKQWKLLKDNTYGFGDVKSKNSNRIIPLTQNLIKELKEFKRSSTLNIDGRIFNEKDTRVVNSKFNKYIKRRGFDISVHELRHTYATTLISNGVDFKTAAQLLGHDVEQTMKTYSHVTDDMLKRASNILENIF